MSVNLLLLANGLQRSLHNKSSRSKTYTSRSTGTNIPGTNIKQGGGIQSIARKGRNFSGVKDTELRKVGGEVAHVNTTEANAIDTLGPLGEAWVQNVGSGTINPKTGLREYSWLSDRFNPGKRNKNSWWVGENSWYQSAGGGGNDTWRPSQGKWGWFGQSYKSRQRDKAKEAEAKRKRQFESWTTENKQSDVTDWFDNEGDIEKYILGPDNSTMTQDEFNRVIDPYDERAEDEALSSLGRGSEQMGGQMAGNTFGLLTEASTTDAKQGFVSAGNFEQDIQQEEMLKTGVLEQEEDIAEYETSVEDIHDEYGRQFWGQMTDWNAAKTA